jgi:hypothetical protein
MPEMIVAVDLIRENRRIAISEIAVEIKISVVFVHTIAAEEVHYGKDERWIPRHLTPEITEQQWDVFCASRTVRAGGRDFFEGHNYRKLILLALFHTGKQTR